MGQHPKDRLLELGAELALLGEHVELARLQLYSVVDAGYSLSSPEALEANRRFDIISNQFLALEEQFEACLDELQEAKPAQCIENMGQMT